MGSRPQSTLIFGFVPDDYEPNADFDDDDAVEAGTDIDNRWEALACAASKVPGTFAEAKANGEDWDDWYAAKQVALRIHGSRVQWAYLDEPAYAFGFVLAQGDWDHAEPVDNLTPPKDAEEKLRKLCKFYDVEYQEPRMLLLSGYG